MSTRLNDLIPISGVTSASLPLVSAKLVLDPVERQSSDTLGIGSEIMEVKQQNGVAVMTSKPYMESTTSGTALASGDFTLALLQSHSLLKEASVAHICLVSPRVSVEQCFGQGAAHGNKAE